MKLFISSVICLTGVIHLLPSIGVLSSEALTRLYGVSIDEGNVLILMRHRAVMFGLMGLLMIYFGLRAEHHFLGLAVAIISTLSFILLAYGQSELTPQVVRVFWIDVVCLLALVMALILALLFKIQR